MTRESTAAEKKNYTHNRTQREKATPHTLVPPHNRQHSVKTGSNEKHKQKEGKKISNINERDDDNPGQL